MSFDIICQNCGAPSPPHVGVCPYCKSVMTNPDESVAESHSLKKFREAVSENRLEDALYLGHQLEQSKPALLENPSFVAAYARVMFECSAPSSRIRAAIQRCHLAHPEHAEITYLLEVAHASLMLDHGSTSSGIEKLKLLIRSRSDDPLTLFMLGSHLVWQASEPAMALPYLQRAARLRPKSVRVLGCLARANEGVGATELARSLYERCAKLETNAPLKKQFETMAQRLAPAT